MPDDGFHDGELLAQRRAGVAAEASRLGGMVAAAAVGEGMRRFLAERELAFLTAEDGDGVLWTSPVFGPRGFCDGRGDELTLASTPSVGDPLHGLAAGRSVGLLFVDFPRRRRLRVNGVLTRSGPDGLAVAVEQAFGNCPRYITPRPTGSAAAPAGPGRRSTRLTPAQVAQITGADTFVLGTRHPERGVDTSHRGGAPGFVRYAGGELWWPDYPGNNLFTSIGNLLVDPATSLLVLDAARGTTVQLTGRSTVEWAAGSDPDDQTGRRIRFTPDLVV
jgi:uncharacterized protein